MTSRPTLSDAADSVRQVPQSYPYAVTDDTGHAAGYHALVDAMKAAALRWREGKTGVVVHDRVRDVRWRPGEGRR